jgi:multidrug efflux pump subunit AcrB
MADHEERASTAGSATYGRGPIAWMARNPVAANLLMVVVMAGGVLGLLSVKQEVFPEFSLDRVVIAVPYPGASPSEVEQGIVLAVEEAVRGVDGVKQVTSVAAEGLATIVVELLLGADQNVALADITSAVERVTTLPADAEEPNISLATIRQNVVSLVVSGDHDLRTLHDLAERVRARLLERGEITQVEVQGVPPLEIAVEVGREALEAHGLTLDDVARQIQAASIELPGGGLETRSGQILVRVSDRRLWGEEYADIVIRGTAAGYDLRLGDIATVVDGYADTDQASYFDGRRAVRLVAYRIGDETPTSVASAVREVSEEMRRELPPTVTLTVWGDSSRSLRERIDLLVSNAAAGFILVVVVLGLFLRASLAGWIALGIPVSFLGAFAVMPALDMSINMISLFALIVTLGLVVDDAIVVGENVFTKLEAGVPPLRAVVDGTHEMVMPVAFSILTTLAAFAPMFFVPGVMGKIFFLIPAVVFAVLLFSWAESAFVLPAHLAHGKPPAVGEQARGLARLPAAVSGGLRWFLQRAFRPFLEAVLRYRYLTVAVAVASVVVCVAAVVSGVVPFSFFPKVDGEVVTAAARLPYGAPAEQSAALRRVLEEAGARAIAESGGEAIREGTFTRVGEGPPPRNGPPEVGGHLVTVELALVPAGERHVTASDVARAWQAALPPFPGLESIAFTYDIGPGHGAAVDVQLTHPDGDSLALAAEELTAQVRGYEQLINVQSFTLRPSARSLGLTSFEVARQLRGAFFGVEALREQRGRNELKVMVRFPESQRQSEHDLARFDVRTPAGGQVPLGQVAAFARGRAPTSITREDGRRIVNVTAELAPGTPSSRQVLENLTAAVLPALRERHPGLEADFAGQQRDQAETFASLGRSFLFALFVIYALLAIPFRSYSQPLIIMSAIPFGLVGAVAGHVIMGYGLSLMSVFGIVALAGVVVNNSLVLIDATNGLRAEGAAPAAAVVEGAARRFRPILLTSLTTFFGLAPLIFETSLQAQFLIPMAISLGFGILFAIGIGLAVTPALYMILEDVHSLVARAPHPAPAATPADTFEPGR